MALGSRSTTTGWLMLYRHGSVCLLHSTVMLLPVLVDTFMRPLAELFAIHARVVEVVCGLPASSNSYQSSCDLAAL